MPSSGDVGPTRLPSLRELEEQRALVARHLAWLDAQLAEARHREGTLTATPPAPPTPATLPAVSSPALPPALPTVAAAPVPIVPSLAPAELLPELPTVNRRSIQDEVRWGCQIPLLVLAVLFAIACTAWILPYLLQPGGGR